MKLNLNDVAEQLRLMADLTEEELPKYMGLVRSAKNGFELLLMREIEDDEERSLCEYACAARAYYDYTVYMAAMSKTYSSQVGSVFAKVNDNESVKNAEILMTNAFASLPKGLIRDNGFVFESTNG